jgi:hypothetical protein
MRPYAIDDGPARPRTRDDVKTLTMLALSAHSRSLKSRNQSADAPNGPAADNAQEDAE